jgi:hypothetical protein
MAIFSLKMPFLLFDRILGPSNMDSILSLAAANPAFFQAGIVFLKMAVILIVFLDSAAHIIISGVLID